MPGLMAGNVFGKSPAMTAMRYGITQYGLTSPSCLTSIRATQ
jgi:hypothetical protein